MRFHWYLPTSGDSREVVDELDPGGAARSRPPTLDYLSQVAAAVEHCGFEAVLTPTGTWCEDAWITTAALVARTSRLKYLVAFRPGFVAPTLTAQMAATYQRMSRGRLLLNVVVGGDPVEQRRFGDSLRHDERYQRAGEFLTIVRAAWSGNPFDFTGRWYHVEGATVRHPPDPVPEIYFGGASPAAEQVAARHADVYLTWGEPPEMVAPRLERMRALAAAEGRSLRFGIRLHVITRERSADAWAQADRMLERMTPAAVAAAQSTLRSLESVGQQRMVSLHQGSRDRLVVAPNLWVGIGLVRGGSATALVGSHDEVAERIEEYRALGFDEFILSGYPHLEAAYEVAEGPLVKLRAQGNGQP